MLLYWAVRAPICLEKYHAPFVEDYYDDDKCSCPPSRVTFDSRGIVESDDISSAFKLVQSMTSVTSEDNIIAVFFEHCKIYNENIEPSAAAMKVDGQGEMIVGIQHCNFDDCHIHHDEATLCTCEKGREDIWRAHMKRKPKKSCNIM